MQAALEVSRVCFAWGLKEAGAKYALAGFHSAVLALTQAQSSTDPAVRADAIQFQLLLLKTLRETVRINDCPIILIEEPRHDKLVLRCFSHRA